MRRELQVGLALNQREPAVLGLFRSERLTGTHKRRKSGSAMSSVLKGD